jgi:Dolichyl-phosphate-mannose-protein mannosyltransferase
LMAGGIKLGVAATTAARIIDAVGYATLVVLFWLLVRRHVQSIVIALAAVAVIAFSHGLIRIYDKAWSEPVFLVLLLAGLLVLEDALRSDGRRALRLFAAAGALFGLSFLARYAGVSLAVVGTVTILLSHRRSSVRDVTTRLVVFALAWALIPALWLARNALSDAPDLTGARVGFGGSPFSTLRPLALGVGAIFLPEGAPTSLAYIVSALVLALLVVGIWLAVRRDAGARSEGSYSLLPIVVLPVVYSGFVCFTYWRVGTSIDARMILPVYVSAVLIGAVILDNLRMRVWEDLTGWAKTTIPVVLGGVLFVVSVATVANAAQTGRTAHVYAIPALRSTPMATAVRGLASNALVATNEPFKLYFITEHQPIVFSPGVSAPGLSLRPLATLTRRACTTDSYLAWFGPSDRSTVYPLLTPDSIGRQVRLDVVDRLGDGTLYKVPGADC